MGCGSSSAQDPSLAMGIWWCETKNSVNELSITSIGEMTNFTFESKENQWFLEGIKGELTSTGTKNEWKLATMSTINGNSNYTIPFHRAYEISKTDWTLAYESTEKSKILYCVRLTKNGQQLQYGYKNAGKRKFEVILTYTKQEDVRDWQNCNVSQLSGLRRMLREDFDKTKR